MVVEELHLTIVKVVVMAVVSRVPLVLVLVEVEVVPRPPVALVHRTGHSAQEEARQEVGVMAVVAVTTVVVQAHLAVKVEVVDRVTAREL